MATTQIIDPTSISFEQIKNDLVDFVQNAEGYDIWRDFFESSAGQIIIELLAGLGTFITWHAIVARREAYLHTARVRDSGVGIAETLGYSVNRGSNLKVKLNVTPDQTAIIQKYSIVGTYSDYNLVNLEDLSLVEGTSKDIELIVGDLNSEEKTYSTSEVTILRFESDDISEDYRLLLDGVAVPYSNLLLDLIYGKYVTLTNHLGGADVFFLNQATVEVTEVTCNVAAPLLGGKYFTINSPYTRYYVWYDVNYISTDPAPVGKTGVEVSIANTDSAETVASKTAAAVNNLSDFTATASLDKVTILNVIVGNVIDSADVNTGFTISTVNQGGDVSSSYLYTMGSALKLEYISTNSIENFITADASFLYGDINSSEITRRRQPVQTLAQIKVAAPFYHETQKVIRGREDYLKNLLLANSNIVDTNGVDISPAIIELSYVKSDWLFFTDEEKDILIDQVSLYRPFGVMPPRAIINPTRINLNLLVTVKKHKVDVTALTIRSDIRDILNQYDGILEGTLDFPTVEEQVEELSYAKIARIIINGESWGINKGFREGAHVKVPGIVYGDYIYQGHLVYKSGLLEPTWPLVIGQTIVDNEIIWQCEASCIFSVPRNKYEVFELDVTDIANKYIDLTYAPREVDGVLLFIIGGTTQVYGQDYEVHLTQRLVWGGLGLDGVLAVGDKLAVYYSMMNPFPVEFDNKTYTLDATDITNKYVTLDYEPYEPNDVVLLVVGDGAQIYGVDYAVHGENNKTLTWAGLALESTLVVGDQLTVYYKIKTDYETYETNTYYELDTVVHSPSMTFDKSFRCVGFVNKTGSFEPTWPGVVGEEVVDFEIRWEATVEDNAVTDTWAASTTKFIGDRINANSLTFVCVGFVRRTAIDWEDLSAGGHHGLGLWGGGEPAWPIVEGTYVFDNQVKWTCRNVEDNPYGAAGLRWSEFLIIDFDVVVI